MGTNATAAVGGWHADGLSEVSSDLGRLDGNGRWMVALPYTGQPVLARFDRWTASTRARAAGRWRGPDPQSWSSSLDRQAYINSVASIRASIAAGDVYQVNLCRVMRAPLADAAHSEVAALSAALTQGNPAPFAGFLDLPDHGVHLASASPELFLRISVVDGQRVVRSGPIKGTGRVASDLTAKDAAENVMIVDLVRNDLSIVCETGSVSVPCLLQVQAHPGLVHLVSYVEGRLRSGIRWQDILGATFPAGSITGAPKLAAIGHIARLEPAGRSYYCGAFGWVDAETGEAELAVAIRTFWIADGQLHFGTGAGITWGSDAEAEWRETELKAARLVGLASSSWQGGRS